MNKLAPLLLAGSLILNAGLAVLLALGARSNDATPESAAPSTNRVARASGPVIDGTVWPSLSEGDLPEQVKRLRESGFPPAIVRAIIQAQLSEEYVARRKTIDPGFDTRPFWKTFMTDPATTTALRQLSRDQQKALRELLGPDAEPDDPMMRARDGRQFGHLPAEKATDARRIVREFNDLRSDFFMSVSGGGGSITMTTADREKLNGIDKQMKAELAKIMTPKEFEDYELRASNTANSLRYQLTAFDATEAEFLTLYKLQKGFDDRFGQLYSQPSQEEMRIRSEAQRQLNDQIKAALAPARAEAWERATNYEYRTTSQLVARLELPPDTTDKAWSVRDEFQKRVTQVRQDQSLTPEQRNQQYAALQKEAVEKVAPLFGGARGVEAYKQYGGRWIESLVPRPPPDAPRPAAIAPK
jgi:hypothetical protein